MPLILAVSSWVARGHVGLSAAIPVLQAGGCEALSFPTVILSNHPGHAACAGSRVAVDHLQAMLDALDQNGWLSDVDAILTGYFPSPEDVAFAASAIQRVRRLNPRVQVWCDPVIGDDPRGLYVPNDVAEGVRDRLLPLSDCITPNRFELQWLSGRAVTNQADAVDAARALGASLTLVTSVPAGEGVIANIAVTPTEAWSTTSALREAVPHGTGDALAAAFLAARSAGRPVPEALGAASGAIDTIVAASLGRDELQLVQARDAWTTAPPAAVSPLTAPC